MTVCCHCCGHVVADLCKNWTSGFVDGSVAPLWTKIFYLHFAVSWTRFELYCLVGVFVAMNFWTVFIFLTLWMLGTAKYDHDYEDEKETKSSSRCSSNWNHFKNGRAKIRARGRLTKFVCNYGFELVGKRFATCVRGQWNQPSPVCIAIGCDRLPEPANGRVKESYRGAYLVYDCLPGYSLKGAESVYCDSYQWSDDVPTCEATTSQSELSCDFEDPDLCGWINDPADDFNWLRHNYETPSGHVGTGPSYDHTYGEGKAGFYMYIEASAPRKAGDIARLFSPVYSKQSSPGCFSFWFHMYGAGMGELRVYIKSERNIFGELTSSWVQRGDAGTQWNTGYVTMPKLNENFQIVIEGVRGETYISDMAIDDVSLSQEDCNAVYSSHLNGTNTEDSTYSCRGRCRILEHSEVCDCSDYCVTNNSCCEDYFKICTIGADSNNKTDSESINEDAVTKNSRKTTEFTKLRTTTVGATTRLPPRATTEVKRTSTNKQSSTTMLPTTIYSSSTTALKTPYVTAVTTRDTEKYTNPILISPSTKYTTSFPRTSTRLPFTSTIPSTTSTTLSTLPIATTPYISPIPLITTIKTTLPPPPITTTTSTTSTSTVSTTSTSTASTTSTTTASTTSVPTTTRVQSTKQPKISTVSQKSTPVTRVSTVTTKRVPPTTIKPTTKLNSMSTQPSSSTTNIFVIKTTNRPYFPPTVNKTTQTSITSTVQPKTTIASTTPKPKFTTTTTTHLIISTPELTTRTTTSLIIVNQARSSSREEKFTTAIYAPTTKPITTTSRSTSRNPFKLPSTTEKATNRTVYLEESTQSTTTRRYNLRPRYTTVRSTTVSPPRRSTIRYTVKTTQFVRPPTTVLRSSTTESTTQQIQTSTNKDILQNTEKSIHKVSESSTPIAGISVAILLVIVLAGGVVYYLLFRRKKLFQKNLSEDSEIRFLSDNEIVEFSDASALDRLRFK